MIANQKEHSIIHIKKLVIHVLAAFLLPVSCNSAAHSRQDEAKVRSSLTTFSQEMTTKESTNSHKEVAVLGAGCFWCVEAVFQRLNGVLAVESGYTGGSVKNPTYKEICTGATGHAEVCRVEFDNSIVSFTDILEVFFATHDPTTLNRQGNDVGTQYRSAIFYTNEQQGEIAKKLIAHLTAEGVFASPIVTEVTPLGDYYPAEDYHQNYFNENPAQPYCSFVVRPKVEKFIKSFRDKLKAEE